MNKNWELTFQLFEKIQGFIVKIAKKYLNYSTMELRDFIGEAQVVLHLSLATSCLQCESRGNLFDEVSCMKTCKKFWNSFLSQLRKSFQNLADIPGECKLGISNSKKPVTRIPITEKWDEEENGIILKAENSYFDDSQEEKQYTDITPVLQKFTKKEKEVFLLLERGLTLDEIAKRLNFKHKQGVYMTIKRMLAKIEKNSVY